MKLNTLAKSIEILDLFLSLGPNLTESDISRALNMPASTTYKYLSALREHKLLDYDSRSRQFTLGSKFLEFSKLHHSQSEIHRLALPYMKELHSEADETVTLDVLINRRGYVLEAIGKDNGIGLIVRRGDEIPLHCGASGLVLLAFQEDKDVELFLKTTELKKYTERTIVDPEKLRERLRGIRKAGYAFSDGERHLAGRAVAAPIFDHLGRITASLSVAAFFESMPSSKVEHFKQALIKCTSAITEDLRL